MKYLKLISSYLIYNLKRELEFRFNLVFFLFFNTLWIFVNLGAIFLVFRQAGTIAGWTSQEAYLLLFIYYLTAPFIRAFIIPGISEIPDLVRRGALDYFLAKPIDLQFLISIRKIYWNQAIRPLIMLFVIPWYLSRIQLLVSPFNWLLCALVGIASVIGIYSVFLIISCSVFWFENIWNLDDLYREIMDVSKQPADIFTGFMKNIIIFVLPVALIASIPAQILLGKIGWQFSLIVFANSLILFIISRFFFRFALRRYESASS